MSHRTPSRIRPHVLFALFAALALVATEARAQEPLQPRPRPRPTLDVSLELEDAMGRPLRTFRRAGQTFVLGAPGARYAVRVRNQSGQRMEAVVSIDGRDAVNGLPSDGVTPRGYLVPPFGTVLIEGFRTSLSSVAAFRFSDPSESYAALMGTPVRIGEIELHAFAERQRPPVEIGDLRWRAPPTPDAPRAGAAHPSPSAAESNLGTGWGEERDSQVMETTFERANPAAPTRSVRVHYDDADGLLARGIDVFGTIEPCRFAPRCGLFVPPPPPDDVLVPPPPPWRPFAPPSEGRFATPPPGF
ncbi:MAG: hypothetical protein IT373_27225 [Polyangiaceae bacterium]|nr:hypothetical protein [Polyangiaceae bacterium]